MVLLVQLALRFWKSWDG